MTGFIAAGQVADDLHQCCHERGCTQKVPSLYLTISVGGAFPLPCETNRKCCCAPHLRIPRPTSSNCTHRDSPFLVAATRPLPHLQLYISAPRCLWLLPLVFYGCELSIFISPTRRVLNNVHRCVVLCSPSAQLVLLALFPGACCLLATWFGSHANT